MLELVTHKQAEFKQLCQQFHVERLEVFGSAATGAFNMQESDLDFLVRFQPAPTSLFDLYFGLNEALEALFGRKVDLVMEGALRNSYFIQGVNETCQLLYAAQNAENSGGYQGRNRTQPLEPLQPRAGVGSSPILQKPSLRYTQSHESH